MSGAAPSCGGPRAVHHLLQGGASDAPAIRDHDGALYTYADLAAMVDDTAAALAEAGVRAGDRVMLVSENSALYAALILAINRLGAWIVPVNARHTPGELDAIEAHSTARLMAFTTEASPAAAAHAAARGGKAVRRLACGNVVLSPTRPCEPEPAAADIGGTVAALIYTTGTTSAPKGVMLTNANLIWNARTSAELRDFSAADEVLGVLPGTHIFGFSSTFLSVLTVGALIRFLPRFSAEAVLDAFEDGVSAMTAVPHMYERILTHLANTGRPFRALRLRYISAGGAPLDPDWKARTEAVFGLTLNNGYGLTETSPGIAATRPASPRRDTSLGPALPGVTVTVDAPDEDGIGELIVTSPGMMKGYYRDEAATRAVLLPGGRLRSGDLGKVAPDGSITIVGRTKELIIRGGFNVYPPEIEAMLTRDPVVLQAAVVGMAAGGEEQILAFVLAPGGDAEAIRARLRSSLAPYKVPQHLFVVDEFPTAPTGKILKHKLVSHFADLIGERLAHSPPERQEP